MIEFPTNSNDKDSLEDLKKEMTQDQFKKAKSDFFEIRKAFHDKYVTLNAESDKELIELIKIKICKSILGEAF